MPVFRQESNSYLDYTQEYEQPLRYTATLSSLDNSSEIHLETTSITTESKVFKKELAVEEAYVIKIDGEEILVYNSNMMEKGKNILFSGTVNILF